ncbi:MAG: ferritin [Candidatus Omnitrophica bacterium CG11_big_fil_rev_8_21_14_0_20_64_10]|nr:MAG: ferritin [Candidatus Omnitrophica bacterium CG11_big_fil_rev_8_21_14_0_20_64_10]
MLSKKMQEALNDQITEEAYASDYYLSMASWCDTRGYRGAAGFMYTHSEQERMHMMKLFRYVNAAGGYAAIGEVGKPPQKFESLQQIMEKTLEHERDLTRKINGLVGACLAEKDYSTFNFLQWYVAEQHEEERVLQLILDLLKISGADGRGLLLVDKEIGALGGNGKPQA